MKALAVALAIAVACTRGDMCCSYWSLPEPNSQGSATR